MSNYDLGHRADPHSHADIAMVYLMVHEAIRLLGLETITCSEILDFNLEIKDLAEDIYLALTGEEVESSASIEQPDSTGLDLGRRADPHNQVDIAMVYLMVHEALRLLRLASEFEVKDLAENLYLALTGEDVEYSRPLVDPPEPVDLSEPVDPPEPVDLFPEYEIPF